MSYSQKPGNQRNESASSSQDPSYIYEEIAYWNYMIANGDSDEETLKFASEQILIYKLKLEKLAKTEPKRKHG